MTTTPGRVDAADNEEIAMLYEEMTTGAMVAARRIDTGEPLTSAQAQEVQNALARLNEEHGVAVTMFVPGDSVTDHEDDPDMELYTPELYFGFSAIEAVADETPCELTLDACRVAKEQLAKVPEAFWTALGAVEGLPHGGMDADLYLMCYGPLPYAVLAFGVTHPSDDKDAVAYKFFSCQNMDQEWLPEGVDGVEIAGVDYDSVVAVPLSANRLGELARAVGNLESPRLYLTVRYD